MENKKIYARVQDKRDAETNWESENPVLLDGESIIVDLASGGFRRKTGDGVKNYNELPFDDDDIREEISEINAKLTELMYEPISITSFTNNVNTVEIGSAVTAVTLSWVTNKTPTSLTLDGSTIAAGLTEYPITGLTLTSKKTYTLIATDEKSATAKKTTSVDFANRICYGVAEEPDDISSDFVTGLTTKVLSNTKGRTVNYDAGSGEYLWYCLPVRLGTCSFTDVATGFGAGLNLVATVNVTNTTTQHKEDYYVYRSDYANLGSLSVKVV